MAPYLDPSRSLTERWCTCAGKLDLYVAAAGFCPGRILPVVVDVGTNNRLLKDDPLYLGLNKDRMTGPEYYEVSFGRVTLSQAHISRKLAFYLTCCGLIAKAGCLSRANFSPLSCRMAATSIEQALLPVCWESSGVLAYSAAVLLYTTSSCIDCAGHRRGGEGADGPLPSGSAAV